MADLISIDLVRAGLFTDQVVLDVCCDVDNLSDNSRAARYRGAVVTDYYRRRTPRPVHGAKNLGMQTSSTSKIMQAVTDIYDEIVDRSLTVRRLTIAVTHLVPEGEAASLVPVVEQLDLFTDYETLEQARQAEKVELELRRQGALIGIRDRYGKNAIVKGLNMQDGAMAIDRNGQIGGHRT